MAPFYLTPASLGAASQFMLAALIPVSLWLQMRRGKPAPVYEDALWAQALASVPPELLQTCREALERFDMPGFAEALARGAGSHPLVVRRLMELADNYQFEELARLLAAGSGAKE